jgi:tetratricopeptide (TPR) repeat protein
MEDLRNRYRAQDRIRRGVCRLNAGLFESAEAEFTAALAMAPNAQSLSSCLAACRLADGDPLSAAEHFSRSLADGEELTARIRHALCLAAAGRHDAAIASLREGVAKAPEQAELHFQLGVQLAATDQMEEAELRFTQAVNLDDRHAEAWIQLAMCHGVAGAPDQALSCLQRGQALRPDDARLGLLLAQAARAARQLGRAARVRAVMPPLESPSRRREAEALAQRIEGDVEIVEAFLTPPAPPASVSVLDVVREALESLLARRPNDGPLRYYLARVLDRLGSTEKAIVEMERAEGLNPGAARSLVELGKLYQRAGRSAEARDRFERAVAAGADYADVHFQLGNLYREEGAVGRARSAYRRAVTLNHRYEAAQAALQALPV